LQRTSIGFRPWNTGRCSSPGTGPTCTKTGQLALSIVRQGKLGVSSGVEVPGEQGLTGHSYRVLQ
jgi:hypothetical protein